MDAEAKKTALRMIPYGLYVLTAEGKDGKIAASTVNWVTQTAFQPPLVVVGGRRQRQPIRQPQRRNPAGRAGAGDRPVCADKRRVLHQRLRHVVETMSSPSRCGIDASNRLHSVM